MPLPQLGLWADNKRPPCFECGALSTHDHHVVPHSRGGTATVPLCEACHGKVHGRRLKISQLTRDALLAKQARGELTGSVRIGFKAVPAERVYRDRHGRTKTKTIWRLEPDANEQRAIAMAQELNSEGKSLRAIASALAEAGYRSRKGKVFAPAQVVRMLEKRAATV